MGSLIERYRPESLDQMMGQGPVVRALRLYLKDPYSAAFLFHGESGTGKTSAAYCLAKALGCSILDGELGGLHEIPSGEQTADRVRTVTNLLRLRPLVGSGWKVLIVNEADRMLQAAESIWLDVLEHMPLRCVIVFTTNNTGKLSKRLRDRCEVYRFESDSEELAAHIDTLVARIWKAEKCKGPPPKGLGMPTLGTLETMHASFRLAVQQLARYIREHKAGGDLNRLKEEMARDHISVDTEADCEHCGVTNQVTPGARRWNCSACRKVFEIEW
jgi:replication-associated recombination protein RarA